jgi:hypothetical protein
MLIQCWYCSFVDDTFTWYKHGLYTIYIHYEWTPLARCNECLFHWAWPRVIQNRSDSIGITVHFFFSFMVRFGHQEHSRTITPVQGWQRGFVISRAALGAKHAAGFVQNTMEHAEDLRGGPSWGGCRKRFGNVSMCCISFEYVPFNIGTVHVYYIYTHRDRGRYRWKIRENQEIITPSFWTRCSPCTPPSWLIYPSKGTCSVPLQFRSTGTKISCTVDCLRSIATGAWMFTTSLYLIYTLYAYTSIEDHMFLYI